MTVAFVTMSWMPPDENTALLLQKIVARARDTCLAAFNESRRRIETDQAARGVLGGPVASRCIDSAGTAIRDFGRQVLPELTELLEIVVGGPITVEEIEWIRTTVNQQVDGMASGLARQIDEMKTTGGFKGAAVRLERLGAEAKRDIDIDLEKAKLRSRGARYSAPPALDTKAAVRRTPKYNLLVSGSRATWSGSPVTFPQDRVFEHTDPEVVRQLSGFGEAAINELLRLPCLFAYEQVIGDPPLFGGLLRIIPRLGKVRIEYEIIPVAPFLSARDLVDLAPELHLEHIEPHRSHWAVKEVDLEAVLKSRAIILPPWVQAKPVDIATHVFDIALSFPGEVRDYVELVANQLEKDLGPHACFYDRHYTAQLARPSMDTLLQGIYQTRAQLVVAFIGASYQDKPWCGLEFRAIREIIMKRAHGQVMFVKIDDGRVDGVFDVDGYVDSRKHSAIEVADMIRQRLESLSRSR